MKQYQKITKQIGFTYGIQVLDFILIFLLFIILTRSLTQYEFGIYSILNVTLLFLAGLFGLGLNHFILRDLAGKKEHIKKERFSQIFTFLSWMVLTSTILLVVLVRFILNSLNYNSIFLASVMTILCSGLIVLGDIIAYYAYAKKHVVKTTFIHFLLISGWALPIIFLSFLFPLTINLIFLSKLMFTVVVLVCTILYFKRRNSRKGFTFYF